MSNNAKPITPEQALQILRELGGHPQLRFLNLAEHSAVQQSLEALAPLVSAHGAKKESVQLTAVE